MKKLYILIFFCAFSAASVNAQVQNVGTWNAVGDVNLSIVTSDQDNGDGVADGALFVDGQSTVVGQGATHTFGGSMTLGESISISTYTYNPSASYVEFKIELYNETDLRVLAASGSNIMIGGNDPTPVNSVLNYTALANDVGDVLQVRYIRTDNGHSARNFAIDNLSLNGTYMSLSSCSFSVSADIALVASNASNESDINLMISRYSDDYLGTSTPSVSRLNSAISSYNALSINVGGGAITGNQISNFNDVSFLKTFAQHLKQNPSDTNIQEKARNTIWLTSKQFCTGSLALDHNGYEFKHFAKPAILLKSVLTQEIIDLFEYLLFKRFNEYEHFWEPNYNQAHIIANGSIDTDFIFNHADIQLAYASWHDTEEKRLQYIKGFKRYIERFFSYAPGTSDGIKNDGSGFHHQTAYNNYMYAYQTAANVLYYMRGTAFTITQNAYQVFRDAVYNQYMQANDFGTQALSTSGRNPLNRVRSFNQNRLKKLAIAGGDILGLATADPVFAGMHNRIYGVDSAFNYNTVADYTTGFFQFNHASASAFRKNGWVAFNKGFTNNMWGSEIYIGENRYGRYQSYGALEVIYPGNKPTGNGYDGETWDWNFNPGTTVIKLPWANLHGEKGRVDELQQKRFVGALNLKNKNSESLTNNHGDYGLFAMDFQEQEGLGFGTTHASENHNNTFTFKKSNFYFDDIIVCLGSGISNDDTSNPTITTLYQRLDNTVNPVNVNGVSQSSSGEVSFTGASNNWVLSNYNTGFYVVSGGHTLKVKKELQQTPSETQIWPVDFSSNTTATYYTGYIDHGTSPSNERYEYILKPDTDASIMQTLHTTIQGGNKPYTVHQQNASAHIVEHKAKDVWGYAFFSTAANVTYDKVTDVSASCLVMTEYDSTTKVLLLSVVDPDLGFNNKSYSPSVATTKQITVQGAWSLSQSYSGVSMVSSSAIETVIVFNLLDGLSKEISLDSNALGHEDFNKVAVKVYPNPAKNTINITMDESEIVSVSIISMLGQVLQETKLHENQVDVSGLNDGFYFLNLRLNNGIEVVKKILIKN